MAKMLNVTNPVNGELVQAIPYITEPEMQAMMEKAKKAKKRWEKTPMWQRSRLMYQIIDKIVENTTEVATLLSTEMGKPIGQALSETGGSANIARGFVEHANHIYGQVLPCDNQPNFENDFIFTRREPLGIITCIIPFNYPIELYVHKVVPAVMMGNVVIVKAPSDNPLAMLKLSKIFEEILPEGVVQSLVCERDISDKYLVQNQEIAAISLTGSTATGVKMAEGGAATLKHLFLELGGNDGNIIRADADLDYAVSEMIGGRIFNAGQTCCACKRFIVHRSIMDALADKLVTALKALKIGDALDPTVDMSTVISEKAAIEVEQEIQYTLTQGGELLYGGDRNGAFITPTVIKNVPKTADVASNLEIFGPVFPLIPFDTDEEALEILNNCANGLSSGIITKDLKTAMKMACEIKSGACVLNGQSSYRHMEQAFGGYKMTGIGREGVSTTLEEHSQLKSYIIKGAFDFEAMPDLIAKELTGEQ